MGIVTAAGDRFFCAGWDLKAAAAGEAAEADHGPGGFAGLTELHGRAKPVIAAVNGIAAGGGFELALAADLVVAAEHADFRLPETGLGIIPDSGGVLRLPRRLPRPVAVELLLTGRPMTAAEACDRGLVNQAVPGDQLMPAARAPRGADHPLGAAGRRRRAGGAGGHRGGLRSRGLRGARAPAGFPGTPRCSPPRTPPRGRPRSPRGARRSGRAADHRQPATAASAMEGRAR